MLEIEPINILCRLTPILFASLNWILMMSIQDIGQRRPVQSGLFVSYLIRLHLKISFVSTREIALACCMLYFLIAATDLPIDR